MSSRSPFPPQVQQKRPNGSGPVTIPLVKISLPPAPVESENLPNDCWSLWKLVTISLIILIFTIQENDFSLQEVYTQNEKSSLAVPSKYIARKINHTHHPSLDRGFPNTGFLRRLRGAPATGTARGKGERERERERVIGPCRPGSSTVRSGTFNRR